MLESCPNVRYDNFKRIIFSDSFTTERVQSRAAEMMGGQMVPPVEVRFHAHPRTFIELGHKIIISFNNSIAKWHQKSKNRRNKGFRTLSKISQNSKKIIIQIDLRNVKFDEKNTSQNTKNKSKMKPIYFDSKLV